MTDNPYSRVLHDGGIQNLGPATSGAAVTPSDTVPLPRFARFLWIGGAGAVTVITAEGDTLLLSGIAAGTKLPIACSYVKATGTTATLIVAMF